LLFLGSLLLLTMVATRGAASLRSC
jgi:hypothetical protein